METMVFQPPCSHLLTTTSIYPEWHTMRCWEQADGSVSHSSALIRGEQTGERMQLHYQADPELLTAESSPASLVPRSSTKTKYTPSQVPEP